MAQRSGGESQVQLHRLQGGIKREIRLSSCKAPPGETPSRQRIPGPADQDNGCCSWRSRWRAVTDGSQRSDLAASRKHLTPAVAGHQPEPPRSSALGESASCCAVPCRAASPLTAWLRGGHPHGELCCWRLPREPLPPGTDVCREVQPKCELHSGFRCQMAGFRSSFSAERTRPWCPFRKAGHPLKGRSHLPSQIHICEAVLSAPARTTWTASCARAGESRGQMLEMRKNVKRYSLSWLVWLSWLGQPLHQQVAGSIPRRVQVWVSSLITGRG